jgi:hypothetical protein
VVGDNMAEKNTQRHFAVMGLNTFLVADKLMSNQRLCRLLKYNVRNPFDENLPDVNGEDLIHKQIKIVPKISDDELEKMSYVTAVFSNFSASVSNPEFKHTWIRFDVACPYDEWLLDGRSLRPYLIMEEIDNMFNKGRLAGIGKVQFEKADALNLTPYLGGYSMVYHIHEFN